MSKPPSKAPTWLRIACRRLLTLPGQLWLHFVLRQRPPLLPLLLPSLLLLLLLGSPVGRGRLLVERQRVDAAGYATEGGRRGCLLGWAGSSCGGCACRMPRRREWLSRAATVPS